ncbi:lactate dehydrogenase [Paramagnetospirillum marisnigri]|uniref:site-specific DNA-methyltransferase (adenine-specific) n=1 Tax=Paramagnetospirillum marisnigri TaxID=1285242 RepID=A0A178MHK9_9PROT|nr:DNA methyltransferase [Paramagnetospirillum marisnigri]OAN48201.1 lactate dehydrogenase [Paramagnetospirillum marisnigri]
MNAVEIEQAISELAEQPFDPAEFPFAFLEAFGNKDATLKRLRTGATNGSDVAGGVCQRSNIHLATCAAGTVSATLTKLKDSPATTKNKVKFILATDGDEFQAEDMASGEVVACTYPDFPNHFGFFLPLAGITTVKQIRENAFDIRATSRLNRLYVELLKDNPDWAAADRRSDMNHFMARLIFCFFAEDTDIFNGSGLFTATVDQMSAKDSSNTHEVISAIFRAMNTKFSTPERAELPRWAGVFPYVNGGLFSGSTDVPRFSKIARSYLLTIGNLDWRQINPDIFGSMIQAVADDEERGALGMHYTSVPNILKVLNPLFLDDLRAKLEEAGDNPRSLLNLRKRLSKIRVFDPACGSGNFLVIAYKQMRAIEAEINIRRCEADRSSEIPLTNFRGIELREFPAEIARLALIIAEFQCDILYRGQKLALAEFLPLDSQNWITCGNALRLDWLSICPPTGTGVKLHAEDLFHTPHNQAQIDFENEGGETYICGNPPYKGSKYQTPAQRGDLEAVFDEVTDGWKLLDYVAGWIMKAALYGGKVECISAFVCTNSICQGVQVPTLWPYVFKQNRQILFAYNSFKWSNLASHNAGVTVVIIGLSSNEIARQKKLIETTRDGASVVRLVSDINAYLVPSRSIIVEKRGGRRDNIGEMDFGNKAVDGGYLYLTRDEKEELEHQYPIAAKYVRRVFGATELVRGIERYCLWIQDSDVEEAANIEPISIRLDAVRRMRSESKKAPTRAGANQPHKFEERRQVGNENIIALPRITSENRDYMPASLLPAGTIISSQLFGFYNKEVFLFSLLVSRLHWVWMGTVCARMRTDFSYSNTLGWNTFPIPPLTEKNKADLTRCAEDILLAREAHFPATIADLYDPETMPDNLRAAHERNDEVLERIYIGRRFRNDTERLEKLFEMYSQMVDGLKKSTPSSAKASTR